MPAREYQFYLRLSIHISTSERVIFLYYISNDIKENLAISRTFPNFPKMSEDFLKFSEGGPKFIPTCPIISRKRMKVSEDF